MNAYEINRNISLCSDSSNTYGKTSQTSNRNEGNFNSMEKVGHEATMFLAHTHTRTIKNTMNV